MVQGVVAVHPDGSGIQPVAHTDGSVEVLCVDGSGKAVVGVVGGLDDVLLGLEPGNGAHGAEDLLLHDLHLGGDSGENGGLDEVALVAVALAARLDSGALLLARLDIAHDAVVLELADLRALECVLGEGVADLVLLGALLEGGNELVVDAVLHVNARAGAAALAVVEVDTKVDPVDGVVNVGVVEDNVGRLAAQLERDLLQVGRRGGLHDLPADDGGAREGDLVDVHVRGDGGTGGLAEARDDVDDSRGEPSLLDVLCRDEAGQGRLLGSLQDDSVTRGQGRSQLPRPHEQGEVPGDDLTTDSDLVRSVSREKRGFLVRRGGLTGSGRV